MVIQKNHTRIFSFTSFASFTNNSYKTKTQRGYIITENIIMQFLQYTLKYQFATVGNIIFQQLLGLPMGKSISAPCANILAIIDIEYFYHTPLYIYNSFNMLYIYLYGFLIFEYLNNLEPQQSVTLLYFIY